MLRRCTRAITVVPSAFHARFPIGSGILGMATSRNSISAFISAFFLYVKAVQPFYTQPLDGLAVPAMHSITAGCACLQCAWRIRHCRWWFELPVKGALSTLISTSTFPCPHPRPLNLHRTHQQRQQLLTCSQILASGSPQNCSRSFKFLRKASCHHQAQMQLQA